MDIQAIEHYLNIDASKYNEPSLEALNYYIKRYMLTVPFENINVQNGVPISVEINDLYDKLINQQRGGFCYEMNHFFGTYLEEKGFTVYRMSATVEQPNGNRSPEGSHMSLVVPINDVNYVADVGFGDLPLQALPITNMIQLIQLQILQVNSEQFQSMKELIAFRNSKTIVGSHVTRLASNLSK